MSERSESLRPGLSGWFLLVSALFVTCLVVSNIIAVKLISVFGYVLPAAVIIFPISYICGDVLTEVYGFGRARQVIWLGFFCNAFAVVAIWLGGLLPAVPFWEGQEAYQQILGFAPRLLGASFAAYLVGEFANSYVLAKMKLATNGRFLWARTIGSTLVGQGLDSSVFILLAFVGVVPMPTLGSMILVQWLFKSGYEAIATPATYVVVRFLKRKEDLDVYDRETSFNPFGGEPAGRNAR